MHVMFSFFLKEKHKWMAQETKNASEASKMQVIWHETAWVEWKYWFYLFNFRV